jgi:hypothetical protein
MPTNYNRANLITESASLFPNNNTQEISPADLRQWLEDGTTSFVTQKDKSTLENAIFEAKGTTLASAATVDLNTATGNYLQISGTATINSFGTCPAGARFILMFQGVATLTYNATSLIIPGLANKTTAAGDCCMIVSEGSGNWRIVGYFAISGSGGGGSGTVTSVDLTMPSAFAVSGNPITTSGILAVTGAGLDSQYIRGDGTLANFPNSSGGGASVSYYLNGSVDQGTIGGIAFKELNRTPIIGAGTDFSRNTDGYIQSFITDAGDPNQILIPAGNWNFETYFSASSGGGSPSFYVELYKWDGSTLTLIASNSANPEGITNGTTTDLYVSALAVPATVLALTDRLAIRYYVNTSGRTITLHTEDNNLSQIITTFTTGLTALNGLTAQVQTFATGTSGTDFAISSATNTHTFNIPDASDTARGLITTGNQTLAGIKTFGNGTSAGEIRFLEPSGDGTNYVALKSQATTADYSITLPPAAPTAAQYLQSTGTGGVLQWTSGTTTGVSSIGTINSATKNPNGAVISGSNIIMQTADATNVGLVSIGTQTFAGAKTFTGAATFSASAASAASVTISPGANSSLTNPQLLITSNSSGIQYIGFGTSAAMTGDRNTPTFNSRSIGTKLVLFAGIGVSSVDHAIGVGSGITWISAPSATGHNVSIFGGQSQLAYFQNNGMYATMPGSASQGQITIGTNTASTYAYLDFGGGANVRGVPAATRSVGTRINMLAGSSGTDDHSIGIAANETWIKTNNSTGAIIGFYGAITKIAQIGSTGGGAPIMDLTASTGEYRVNGTKVVGQRGPTYGAPTATLLRNALTNASTTTDVLQTLAALITDLRTHGLIG